jgi:hypothetical protein
VMMHPTLEGRELKYVTATVTNVGQTPAMIPFSFFRWKVPFRRGFWMINPWDYTAHDSWVPQRVYPTEVRPRSSETFFLSELARFRTTMAEMFSETRRARWRLRFAKAFVITADNKIFKVTLDEEIRHELANVRRTAKGLMQCFDRL